MISEFTSEGIMNTKKKRLLECKKRNYLGKLPQNYKTTSTKEELCFEYISKFSKQFSSLFPDRRPLYMIADNEAGVKKFVCSTIRPTELPYQELYDLYECASFLSGYMLYEPLDPPNIPPATICSPTYSLGIHTADCFELSTVLCSFLLGAGFDAYVVYGYAPEYITHKDQTRSPCPLLSSVSSSTPSPQERKEESSEMSFEGSNYVPIDNSVKSSKYIQNMVEQQILLNKDNFELWIPDSLSSLLAEDEPLPQIAELASIHGNPIRKKKGKNANPPINTAEMKKYMNPNRRVHSWVLVCSGRRDIKEHCLVEPTTGRVYSCQNCPYYAIESVWNHENYWINMQPFRKVADVSFLLLFCFLPLIINW